MRQLFNIISVFLVVLLICGDIDVAATQKPEYYNGINTIARLLANEYVEGEVIVKFRSDIADNVLFNNKSENTHASIGAFVKRRFKPLRGLELIKLPEDETMESALEFYLNHPDIEYAEPNYIVYATLTPNDPGYQNLWGLHNTSQTGGKNDADIDAPEAWDISTGTGNVVIAVVDSGVAYDHPDLTDNIWTNAGEADCSDGIDNDGNGYTDDCIGWDFVDDDNDPMDYALHGTHVAGTIAASGDNGMGVTGILWNARIMVLRFLDATGTGFTSDAISAILYANEQGAQVINNSWGGSGFSQALKDAIDQSSAVVVCAAGNNGTNNDSNPFYPASFTSSNIIAVAATDHNDNLASFSNYGMTSVDLGGPGVNIYSTVPARNQVLFDNMTNLNNWNAEPPWGLSPVYRSSPSSAADSPSGNYSNSANVSLTLANPVSLSGEEGSVLQYWMRLDVERIFDEFCIEVSTTGITWSSLVCWYGSTGTLFYFMEEDLTPYDEQSTFFLRFRLETDTSVTRDGAYVDDVKITTASQIYSGSEYALFNGTSMAAPHVSGVAGLIKSFYPALTNLEVKEAIFNSVDLISSLTNRVLTEGRVNAYSALTFLACPNFPVRILSSLSQFSTIQAAYLAAVDGDTVQTQMRAFGENPNFNLGKSVTLKGGYDCDYFDSAGTTTVRGSLNIGDGDVTIENFILK